MYSIFFFFSTGMLSDELKSNLEFLMGDLTATNRVYLFKLILITRVRQ